MGLTPEKQELVEGLRLQVEKWLGREGDARSTLAGAVVVLDALARKAPLSHKDVFTSGGQLVGGRGTSLKQTLSRHGEERVFLADGVTTRSTSKFERLAEAIEWGRSLAGWPKEARGLAVTQLLAPVLSRIDGYFMRRHLSVTPDRQESPLAWVELILDEAHGKSHGRVEQHLVGAKLELSYPDRTVTAHAAFAADEQTARAGDFVISPLVFHVTAVPAQAVVEKCRENLRQGLRPVLVIPRSQVERAKGLALIEEGLDKRIAFLAIEDFIATNIMEWATKASKDLVEVLRDLVEVYNRRIEQTETDLSLRIEIR